MINFIKKLFSVNKPIAKKEFGEADYANDYALKSTGLENVLGTMNSMVGHAIIPFAIGGAVDMYYFSNHIKGTGFATMELLEPDGSGPMPNRIGTYELAAFTKHEYGLNEELNTPFNLIERKICGIFTTLGFYSRQAKLNPNETCELPNGEGEENTCVAFDIYEPEGKAFMIGNKKHHLLLCLQIFRSEMDFARSNGTAELFKLLKKAGHYPYSDLDRNPVI